MPSHELRIGERKTGRIVYADGEVFAETTNDRDYVGGGNSAAVLAQLSKLERKP